MRADADVAASDSDTDVSMSSLSEADNAGDDSGADTEPSSAADNDARGMRSLPNDTFLDTDTVMSLLTEPPSGENNFGVFFKNF